MSVPDAGPVIELVKMYLQLPDKKRKAMAAFYKDLSAWMRETAAKLRGGEIPPGLSRTLDFRLEGLNKALDLEKSLLNPGILKRVLFSRGAKLLARFRGRKAEGKLEQKKIADLIQTLQKHTSPSGEAVLALGALAGVDSNSPLRDIASQLEGTASQLDAWVALLGL